MDLKIEGVSWNRLSLEKQVREGLTQSQFIERGLKEGQYKQFSKDDQRALLRMVYTEVKKGMAKA